MTGNLLNPHGVIQRILRGMLLGIMFYHKREPVWTSRTFEFVKVAVGPLAGFVIPICLFCVIVKPVRIFKEKKKHAVACVLLADSGGRDSMLNCCGTSMFFYPGDWTYVTGRHTNP
jgi:hypothetical protein